MRIECVTHEDAPPNHVSVSGHQRHDRCPIPALRLLPTSAHSRAHSRRVEGAAPVARCLRCCCTSACLSCPRCGPRARASLSFGVDFLPLYQLCIVHLRDTCDPLFGVTRVFLIARGAPQPPLLGAEGGWVYWVCVLFLAPSNGGLWGTRGPRHQASALRVDTAMWGFASPATAADSTAPGAGGLPQRVSTALCRTQQPVFGAPSVQLPFKIRWFRCVPPPTAI